MIYSYNTTQKDAIFLTISLSHFMYIYIYIYIYIYNAKEIVGSSATAWLLL